MKRIGVYIKAVAGFLVELVRPRSRVERYTRQGHEVLFGWEKSPEEEVLRAVERQRSAEKAVSRVSLFCYEGPHHGEIFTLAEGNETLSKQSTSSFILTPADLRKNEVFRMKINGSVHLQGEGSAQFRLNSHPTEGAELLDYDEIEVMGNKFVVLLSDGAEISLGLGDEGVANE